MNVTLSTASSVASFRGPQRSAGTPSETPQAPSEDKFSAGEEEPSRLCSALKGAAYGFGISAAVGTGLSILTMGALAPVAILAVPICTALGAYVGAVNPRFES